jgi:hypothetical protein
MCLRVPGIIILGHLYILIILIYLKIKLGIIKSPLNLKVKEKEILKKL